MNLKIKAVLQILGMVAISGSVGFGFALYNRLVGDQYTLYTIAGACMALLFYSMYRLLLDRLEYEQQVKRLGEQVDKICKK
jgi:hypothetical protein